MVSPSVGCCVQMSVSKESEHMGGKVITLCGLLCTDVCTIESEHMSRDVIALCGLLCADV